MTDHELAVWLGIDDDPRWQSVIEKLSFTRRLAYVQMAKVERDLKEWEEGRGPKPKGVLLNIPGYRRLRILKSKWFAAFLA